MTRFAEHLGLVFQIRDDILDRSGDPATLGKAVQKDMAAGRKTATAIMGLRRASQEADRLAEACQHALAPFGPAAQPLRDLARFAAQRLQ